jgi:hypothetical protein
MVTRDLGVRVRGRGGHLHQIAVLCVLLGGVQSCGADQTVCLGTLS